ncbi:MAG: hypothetical protein AAFO81_06865, partial [Pseudomonadota bacterium]
MLTPELRDLPLLGHDAVVVTAGQRLARACRQYLADTYASNHVAAWREPRILPIDSWLRDCFAQLTLHSDAPMRDLLSPAQSAVVWRNACGDVLQERGLPPAGINALASECQRAFSLMQSWRLSDSDLQVYPAGDNSLLFERCLMAFRRQQRAHGWITDAELGGLLLEQASALDKLLPQTRWFAGFSQLTPIQQALCDALAIDHRTSRTPDASAQSVYQFDSTDAELIAAGSWARTCLQRDADARLAIVVTNLDQHRERYRSRVLEGLDPQSL